MGIYDFLFLPLLLIFATIFIYFFSKKYRIPLRYLSGFFIWHSFFAFLYYLYLKANGGDALDYYRKVLEGYDYNVYPGSPFVISLTKFLYNLFELSFESIFFIFSFLGFLGGSYLFAYIYTSNLSYSFLKKYSLILFLPSLSFWSSALGKDSLVFLGLALIIFSSRSFSKNLIIFFIGLFLVFFVRPHIAFAVLLACAIAGVLFSRLSFFIKSIFILINVAGIYLAIPFIKKYVGLEDDSLSDYVSQRQSYNSLGGSSLDISSMSYPEQLFTYLARPMPYESHSITSFLSSLDNLVLLCVFVYGFTILVKNKSFILKDNHAFLLIFGFITWSMLAVTTANLGIAVRQKWMFVPAFLMLFISLKAMVNNKQLTEKSPIIRREN